jgi:hypothetical protein
MSDGMRVLEVFSEKPKKQKPASAGFLFIAGQ